MYMYFLMISLAYPSFRVQPRPPPRPCGSSSARRYVRRGDKPWSPGDAARSTCCWPLPLRPSSPGVVGAKNHQNYRETMEKYGTIWEHVRKSREHMEDMAVELRKWTCMADFYDSTVCCFSSRKKQFWLDLLVSWELFRIFCSDNMGLLPARYPHNGGKHLRIKVRASARPAGTSISQIFGKLKWWCFMGRKKHSGDNGLMGIYT